MRRSRLYSRIVSRADPPLPLPRLRARGELIEIRAADLELAAFICVTAIEAVTHNAVLHHKMVSDEATGALIDEATRLVLGYLTG